MFVCFDDSDYASMLEPTITVVRQSVYQFSYTVVELLIKNRRWRKNLDYKTTIITLQIKLIVRNSTKNKNEKIKIW